MNALDPIARDGLLYLSAADVERAVGSERTLFVEAVEAALRAQAADDVVQPLKPYLRRPDRPHPTDRIIAMPAYVGGEVHLSGIKWIGSAHDNQEVRGLPRASAVIVLNDADSAYPVAVMDGSVVSAWRTAAVSALACRHLAPEGRRLAILGTGLLARTHLSLLCQTWGRPEAVEVHDVSPRQAESFARWAREEHGVTVTVHDDAAGCLRNADVILVVTTAPGPWIPAEWVPRGSLFLNVSLADPMPDVVLASDKVVVDCYEQVMRPGKLLHTMAQQGTFGPERCHADLSQLVTGARPGREKPEETIFFNPIGQAVGDIACSAAVYRRAVENGVGTRLER
ncbi:2,3-diaminopropionate biosynthesis protein SbnB [Streptomyces sp. NBC_00045]|uniref:2,3-diaminopropionate biosynthesis protein SbnB n=1 Tax=Streptomyces sp. NBC_00045 TaxID=2975625 RepID=UPI002F9197D0